MFFSRLAIFQILQCVCIIFNVFQFSGHIQVLEVHFSFFTFFFVSRHIPDPTMWVYHFSCWSIYSPYSRSNSVCVSSSTFFSFLGIFYVLQCVFPILHVFHCFSSHSRSYHVSFLFSSSVSFLAIFQFLQCLCLIFQVSQFSCHNTVPKVCISHFSRFSCLWPYSRSYSVCFSFCMIFSFSPHIPSPRVRVSHFTRFSVFSPYPGPRVYISHFSRFSLFLTILDVLPSVFLILLFVQCFSPYSRSYSVCVSFSTFFRFLTIFQILQCLCLIFHVFQCFSP